MTRFNRKTGIDFDGTVTDVEKESVPFVESYREEVRRYLGLSAATFDPIWQAVITEIRTDPENFGWLDSHCNCITAPATADPFLMTRVTTDQILYRLLHHRKKIPLDPSPILLGKLPQSAEERHQLLDTFFSHNYKKVEACFRDGAVDFFRELASIGEVTVISNTSAAKVEKKLSLLKEKNPGFPEIRVLGGAEKFRVDPGWNLPEIPAKLDCSPDLKRPVYTQRRYYYEALKKGGLLDAASAVIVGDVWELDLMLPELLGLETAFLTRDRTPRHEKKIVARRSGDPEIRTLPKLAAAIRRLHGMAREGMRLLIFSGIFFSSMAWARTDMTGYYGEKTKVAGEIGQQATEILNKQMQMLKDLMNNPATKKMFQQARQKMKDQEGTDVDFEKMAGDFLSGKTPQVPEIKGKGETFKHAVLDEIDFLVRVYIRYGVERHEIAHSEDGSNRSVLTDSVVNLDLARLFTGKFLKVFDINRKHPDQFHYHVEGMKGEKPEMAKTSYDLTLQITPDGGKTRCRDEEIRFNDGLIYANPLDGDSSKAKRYLFSINAGVQMESLQCPAYPVSNWRADVILFRADMDTLFKEGRLQKVFRQTHPVDLESEMLHEKWWDLIPSDTLLFYDPRNGNKYKNAEVTLEMMLGPSIKGPHFLALPQQTIDLIENEITLKVEPVPGWKIGPIKPVGGWKGDSDWVRKIRETSDSLTLAPQSPGRRLFEVEWTNPKGKTGKSEPFEVTVVLLEFEKEKKCNGFDDVETIPAPAVSMCQGKEKWIRLKSQPAIVDVETELLPTDKKGFQVSPDKFPRFSGDPKKIALLGKNPKSYSMLTARIKIDEDRYQTAAQIYADSMKDRTIKILPLFFDSDPEALAPPDVEGIFNQAKKDLQQACVTLDVLPLETIKPKDVPSFSGGDTVRYDLENWDPLVDYSRKPAHHRGQELTVFIVPFIATAIQDAKGNPTEELEASPLGFQYADVVFIAQAGFSQYVHVLGHEIGHYIFKDMYVSPEGEVHTAYNDMLMYHLSTEDCEIRQEEWRQVTR